MRGYQDDDAVAWADRRGAPAREHGAAPSPLRRYGLPAGFVLAAVATALVFLTDNPQYLRLAVLATAWAFVLAAVLAGRRRADTQLAAAREDEIRREYEYQLEREAAEHREYELELRREAEESMGAELTALRAEVAELALLKHEVARVARLGTDLPALSGLRAELASLAGLRDDVANLAGLRADVASLSALRDDLASLSALRDQLGAVGELRAEMGRLRTELTEQLNGEMLVERILLRTQSSRSPAEVDGPRTVESSGAWEDDRPPRELTGGWPAVRLDGLTDTRAPEPVRVDRAMPATGPRPAAWPPGPPTTLVPAAPPTSMPAARVAPPTGAPVPPTPLEWLADRSLLEPDDLEPRPSRHAAAERHAAGESRELLPPVPPRRRRTDDEPDDRTTEHPATPATSSEPIVRPSPAPRPSPVPRVDPATGGHSRLEEILADNGTAPAPGGRRRRRYREDDEPDDVLARVLGRGGS